MAVRSHVLYPTEYGSGLSKLPTQPESWLRSRGLFTTLWWWIMDRHIVLISHLHAKKLWLCRNHAILGHKPQTPSWAYYLTLI